MKMLILSLLLLTSCLEAKKINSSEDYQYLQSKFKVVYMLNSWEYITIDSAQRVYRVKMKLNGEIQTKIEIR